MSQTPVALDAMPQTPVALDAMPQTPDAVPQTPVASDTMLQTSVAPDAVPQTSAVPDAIPQTSVAGGHSLGDSILSVPALETDSPLIATAPIGSSSLSASQVALPRATGSTMMNVPPLRSTPSISVNPTVVATYVTYVGPNMIGCTLCSLPPTPVRFANGGIGPGGNPNIIVLNGGVIGQGPGPDCCVSPVCPVTFT
jgi:hypothetical protein